MRLIFLVANQAWVFTFYGQLLPMGDEGRFFTDRADAVEAARTCRLSVDRRGVVTADV